MKKILAIAAFAATCAMAPAQAAIINFAAEADGPNGERGFAGFITIDGVELQVAATLGFGTPNGRAILPYFDAGNAGLGACQNVDTSNQCVPGSDDNVAGGEDVAFFFESSDFSGPITRDILGLSFRDAEHNLISMANDGLVRIQNLKGGDLTEMFSTFIAMAATGDDFFADVIGLRLFHVDTPFYVSSATVSDTPIPGALPLLLSGLAGLGFSVRGRSKKA